MKLAGYRPGCHPRSGADVLFAQDMLVMTNLLFDLPFRMFPQELKQLVPHLLEETILPAEALAAVKGFLGGRAPAAKDRAVAAAWLEEIFPGEREKVAQEGESLLAAGTKLIAWLSAEQKGWAKNPAIGDQIGEYAILKILGEGGLSRVYEAEHRQTARHVALKVLHPKGNTRELEERFRLEAEAILRIVDSQHVVGIEGFGSSEDGRFLYLAMELLQGVPLDRTIAKEGPFTFGRALRIASQICQALAEAHAAGVIHRDLRPGNIMLVDRDGSADFVKVLDFGLARLDTADAVLTRVGDLAGTFAYMAPEQAEGKPATPKTDIYAVGEVMYEMLTGKLPHQGTDDILARKATTYPTSVTQHSPDIPEAIRRLVMRALARDPAERQPTMAALGQEIDEILAPISAPVARPSRFKLVAAGIVGASVVAGGIALLLASGRLPAVLETKPRSTRPAPSPAPVLPPREAEPAPSPAQAVPDEGSLLPPAEPAAEPLPAHPVATSLSRPQVKPARRSYGASRRTPQDSRAEQLLREADAASEAGNHIEAIKLGTQALNAGGGVAAHLALASYYRSMSRHREALQHYRAAVQLDPSNAVAAAGIQVIEKQLTPNP